MRNNTLLNLRLMLKAECGININAGVSTGEDKRYNIKLANMQQFLWSQFQWPFLYTKADTGIIPLQRYYNFPATVSFDYPTTAEILWDDVWQDVDYGIKGREYTIVNPDRGETLDPVSRWQNYSPTQLEVWPPPATNQTLRFWGTGNLTPLQADGDTALLDDLLVVLFTGAELLAKAKQQNAQSLLVRANALFNRLKGANRPNVIFTLGGHDTPTLRNLTQRVVGIVGNPNH